VKQKCEEIIIDQYLKGNISNKFKKNILEGFKLTKEDNPNFKEWFMELYRNPVETLKNGEKIFNEMPDPSFKELSSFLDEIIKEDEEENELSE
jgi:hypothetical protein